MNLGLKGKVVLVTASSRGLGKAIATEYAREGARVMIAARNEDELKKTADEIFSLTGSEVDYCVTDVSNRLDIDNLFERTINRFGKLDVLITSAGGPPGGTFNDFEDEVWEQVFQTNLLSVVRLIRGAIPHLRAVGGGRIINIASTSVKQPIEGLLLSNTFRAGILGLSKSISIEFAPENILINTVAPGRIDTDRTRHLDQLKAELTEKTVEEIQIQSKKNIPIGRYGTPQEFAKTVVFLGSEANSYVTGQALLIDGGMVRAL